MSGRSSRWLNDPISLPAVLQRWLWCSFISSARLRFWWASRRRQHKPNAGVVAVAVGDVATVAATAVAGDAAEVTVTVAAMVTAELFAAVGATTATAGAGLSARIDRGLSVVPAHDPDRSRVCRFADTPYFFGVPTSRQMSRCMAMRRRYASPGQASATSSQPSALTVTRSPASTMTVVVSASTIAGPSKALPGRRASSE